MSRADLEGLLHLAGRAAFQRTLGELRCVDTMSKPPFAVEMGVSLKEAWALMRAEQIKALPVVDAKRAVIGIVTVADFMRLANLDLYEGLGQRLRTLVKGQQWPARVGWRNHVASGANGPRCPARYGPCSIVFARWPSPSRAVTMVLWPIRQWLRSPVQRPPKLGHR